MISPELIRNILEYVPPGYERDKILISVEDNSQTRQIIKDLFNTDRMDVWSDQEIIDSILGRDIKKLRLINTRVKSLKNITHLEILEVYGQNDLIIDTVVDNLIYDVDITISDHSFVKNKKRLNGMSSGILAIFFMVLLVCFLMYLVYLSVFIGMLISWDCHRGDIPKNNTLEHIPNNETCSFGPDDMHSWIIGLSYGAYIAGTVLFIFSCIFMYAAIGSFLMWA